MRRKIVSVGAWLVATVASILLATAAVGNVGDWGSDRPAALQATISSLVTLAPTTSTTAPEPVASSTTAVPSTTAGTTTSTTIDSATESTTTTITAPPTTQPPTTTKAPPATTTTTTAAPSDDEYFESIQLVGGWVHLRIEGDNVYFNGAVAEPGFTIDVEHDGPETVEVEFKSESHDSKLNARFKDGELDIKIDEESEDD